ncbi:MAG: glycosyltransferase family 2 protein [Phycisphaerae bacterium]
MRRVLVILTLNEVDGVRALSGRIPFDCADEVLATDGGSTDGTVEALQAAGLRIVPQQTRGRGEAFRLAAGESTGECLLFFSPDGNEDPADIPRLYAMLDEGYDMAIASRFLPESVNEEDDARLPLRKWANQAFTWLANAIWNRRRYVTDTINGYRAITREAFERLAPVSVGFTIEYEMTIRAFKEGLRIAEIPTIEGPRIGGQTKAHSLRTGLVFLRLLLRELLRRG